ncbi:M43 family zinc metalloprotease [Empedobacter tilapiae]|uniref:M43 family zinc metalloprotease n=1 Tax=Empedobacter tilapiae TaxID=2491114 RepID=UPI0028D6BD6C|nr:M43 family zinc metalloprotease [Empedobacter tilapiae]
MNFLKTTILTIASSFCASLSAQSFDDLIAQYGSKHAVDNILRCGSYEYDLYLQQNNPVVSDKLEFENWMKIKTDELKKSGHKTNQVITLPVVVHVIHGGGEIGKNGNITESQIHSQLKVLNQDFRRMADTRGWNDNEVGADIEIEFCLARQTPDGQISDGINRVEYKGLRSVTLDKMQDEIKPQTQWDPTRYINIWVVPEMRSGPNMLLGYAQFPQQSKLPGLTGKEPANTDGVVIWYKSFGSIDYDDGTFDLTPGYALGRTTTHEIGHFLGLRHIWGDSYICEEDDFCEDTPLANDATNGCPVDKQSCGGINMIQNFMDYSGDACMNIFTNDQKSRILTVMQNSPRRKELLNSNVCQTPESHGLDVHVKNVSVSNGDCDENVEASLDIQNRGDETIKNLTIEYKIPESNFSKTFTWSGSLKSWENATIKFPTIYGLINGNQNLEVKIIKVNEKEDDKLENNSANKTFYYSAQPFDTKKIVLKIKTDNFGKETSWKFINKITKEVLYKSDKIYANNTEYEYTFDVEDETCYEFHFIDAGKDGICCAYGEGFYKLLSDNGEEIASGGKFTKTDIDKRSVRISSTSLGINNTNANTSAKVYPNPVSNTLNIQNSIAIQSVKIFDVTGKQVFSKTINAKETKINVTHLKAGIYFVNTTVRGKVSKFKIIKK